MVCTVSTLRARSAVREIGKALEGLGSTLTDLQGIPREASPRVRVDMGTAEVEGVADETLSSAHAAAQAAIADAVSSTEPPAGPAAP